jgi:hypothetical protein
LVGVAVDVQGSRAARRYVEGSGVTFPTVVDAENALGALVEARAIPNGIFLDEEGVVRYLKLSGFSIEQPDDVAAIEGLLRVPRAGGMSPSEAPQAGKAGQPAPSEGDLARSHALFAEGTSLLERGQSAEAVARWQAALALDPKNWIIRKQIWVVRHPERFYPTIDWAWQKEQIAREEAS